MQMLRVPLQVVFYRDEKDWVAHCLQFDLCGDGPTKQTAMENLGAAIRIQVDESLAHNNPRNLFTPADGEYFRMFALGKDIAESEVKIDFGLRFDSLTFDEILVREYSDNDLIEV